MTAKDVFEKQAEDVQIAILEIVWRELESFYFGYWAEHFDLSDDVLISLRDELGEFLNSD